MKKLLFKLGTGLGMNVAFLSNAFAQETQIKFFGQPEFVYRNTSEKGKWVSDPIPNNPLNPTGVVFDEKKFDTTNTNFNTGKFVMFVTSQLNEKISVLSENSADMNSNGDVKFEIERLLLRYYVKPVGCN